MSSRAPGRGRRRGWPWLLLVLLVLSGGGLLATRVLLAEEDLYASPETVPLPPTPADIAPSTAFLSGPEGTLVRHALEATLPLLDAPTVDTCKGVTTALEALGEPKAVFTAAAGFPDPATAEMAARHIDATIRFLGSCFEDAELPATDEVSFTATILSRRIDELQ